MINERHKILLLWLLLVLPLVVLAYFSVYRTYETYQLTQKKLLGTSYHASVYDVLRSARKLRGEIYLNAGTQTEAPNIATIKAQLTQSLDAIEANEAVATELGVNTQWHEVKAQLVSAFFKPLHADAQATFTQQTKATEQLEALLASVIRNSHLALDPKLNSFDAINEMVNTVPRMNRILSNWRGKIAGISANNLQLNAAQRLDLRSDIAYLQSINQTTDAMLNEGHQHQPILAVDALVKRLESVAAGQTVENPQHFFQIMTNGINDLHQTYEEHHQQIDSLLKQRARSLVDDIFALLGMVLLAGFSCVMFIRLTNQHYQKQLATTQQLGSVFNSTITALFLIDEHGVIQNINHSVISAFGYTKDELIGKNLRVVLAPQDQKAHLDYIENQLQPNETEMTSQRREAVAVCKNGTDFPIEFVITESKYEAELTYIVAVHNIQHRKDAERTLAEQKNQFLQLVESQNVATFLIDAEHNVLYWNGACETLTGVKASDIVGTKDSWKGFYKEPRPILADLVLDRDEAGARHYYQLEGSPKLVNDGWHVETWFENLGGKKRYVIFDAVPIFDADGEITAVVETLQDFTDSKLAEEQKLMVAELEVNNAKEIEVMFNSVIDGLMVLDEQGVIETVNESAKKIFGYANDQLIGQPITQLIPAKELEDFEFYMQNYIATSDKSNLGRGLDSLGLRKSGTIFAMDLVLNQADIGGEPKLICTTRDVSQRRYMEKLYRLMSENVEGYATIILDPKGKIKTWNAGAETLKGYKEKEAIGRSMGMFYTEEALDRGLPAILLDTCTRDGHVHDEGWRVRKDGSQFYAEVVLNSLQEDDGSLLGFVKVTRDVTVRKQLDNELQQAYKNLEEFTAVASHDLKSPIRGIADLIDWIQEDLGENIAEDVRNNLNRVQIRVKRMEVLIEDLLKYSRAGMVSAELTFVDPIELIEEVIDLQPIPKDFTVDIKGKVASFQVAKTPLQTSIRNLVSNAINHHDKPNGHIEITAKIEGSFYVFEVADDGPGIPDSARARIFKLFQTLSNNKEMSGIGLTVSKRMIEAHGGYIKLKPNTGRGTTFQVYWPRFPNKKPD